MLTLQVTRDEKLKIGTWSSCNTPETLKTSNIPILSQVESFNLTVYVPRLITQYTPIIRQSNLAMENPSFIDDFPIQTSLYRGFSIATFDYWRYMI